MVGDVGDGHSLVRAVERLQPDVLVLDIGMPLLNGIECSMQAQKFAPKAKLIFLTQYSGKEYIQAAFRAGASAYVLKNAAVSELITAIRLVLAGQYFISSELRQRFGDAWNLRQPNGLVDNCLTPRQREVLQLIAEGKIAKEIAHILDISVKTAEFHKSAIMQTLGLRTTAELTRYAIEHGIA